MPDQLSRMNGMHLSANALFGSTAKDQNELQLAVKVCWLTMSFIVAPHSTSWGAGHHVVFLKARLVHAHGSRAYHPGQSFREVHSKAPGHKVRGPDRLGSTTKHVKSLGGNGCKVIFL